MLILTAAKPWHWHPTSSRKQIRFMAAGKRRSHHLYTCQDPEPKANIKLLDENGGCIVELRLGGGGKGAQSVMPGSIHTSGSATNGIATANRQRHCVLNSRQLSLKLQSARS